MQLSHILLTIRLAIAKVLRPLKPRPGNQVPEPAHALLHETGTRRYPHPFFAVHLLDQNKGIAGKHRLRERLVLDIRRVAQGTVFGRWFARKRLRALRIEQRSHRRQTPDQSDTSNVSLAFPRVRDHTFPSPTRLADTVSDPLFTASLSALPALNDGAFEAAICTLSPFPGFRPDRAARLFVLNVPKPASPHRLFLGQRLGDRIDHRVDRTLGRGPGESHSSCQTADDFRLVHSGPRRNCRRGLSTERAPAQ